MCEGGSRAGEGKVLRESRMQEREDPVTETERIDQPAFQLQLIIMRMHLLILLLCRLLSLHLFSRKQLYLHQNGKKGKFFLAATAAGRPFFCHPNEALHDPCHYSRMPAPLLSPPSFCCNDGRQ